MHQRLNLKLSLSTKSNQVRKPLQHSTSMYSFLHFLIVASEQREKQSVVETDGSEVSQEKKPVTEKDSGQSCHIIIISKT